MSNMVLAGARAAVSLPGLVLLGSMVGFGGFAKGAGWGLFEVILATMVIWALPAQVILIGALSAGTGVFAALAAVSISSIRLLPMVCSVLPSIRRRDTGLPTLIFASHYVAQTVWILTLLNIEAVPRDRRPAFYFALANTTMGLSLIGCVLGWTMAGSLPRPLDIALLMLTPVSFLLSTEKTAKGASLKLAFVLGLVLLPGVHWAAPLVGLGSWELLITGLLAGSIAFAAGEARGRQT